MQEGFNVTLERFSGPYFKLLELIEERKLSINEFSLAEITDAYISYIKSLQEINSERSNSSNELNIVDISQFIAVASTLMLIKAKSLFPNMTYTEEEKESISDLEKKLELYKLVLEAGKNINKIYNKNPVYSISGVKNEEEVFAWDKRVNIAMLHSIAIASFLKIPKKERMKQVAVRQVLKIEDVIEKLLTRVTDSFNLSFKEFSNSVSGNVKSLEEKKSAFIVSFLAMLELIKNGILTAEQSEEFTDINISKI